MENKTEILIDKEKGIAIIGHGNSGMSEAIARTLADKNINVAIIDNKPIVHDNSFELNGERYEPIIEERSKHNLKLGSRVTTLIAMTTLLYGSYMDDMYGLGGFGSNYTRKLPEGLDIVKEYGLIQQKKSFLASWERRKVIRIFEKNYRKI